MTSSASNKPTSDKVRTPPKTNAERQAEYRARKHAGGLQAKTAWVKVENTDGYLVSDWIYLAHIPEHRRKMA